MEGVSYSAYYAMTPHRLEKPRLMSTGAMKIRALVGSVRIEAEALKATAPTRR